MEIKQLLTFCRDLISPRRCIYCGRVQGFAKTCDCAAETAACRLGEDYPGLLSGREMTYLDAGTACYAYKMPVRGGIHKMKFSGLRGFAPLYAAEMADRVREIYPEVHFDGIVPVPSTKREIRGRGYDIPLLMAQELSERLGLPVFENILTKETETAPQHSLPQKERKGNLIGAYGLSESADLRGQCLLVCDDICTTGATLDESARMLKAGGASAVYAVTFAETPKAK